MADDLGSPDAASALRAVKHGGAFTGRVSWDDLRALVAFSVLGSLSQAARALGESQPTTGRRLKRLEEALGVPMVARAPNAAQLTAEGRRLADAAAPMALAAREVAAAARAARPRADDPVRLATTSSIAAFLSWRWTELRAATAPRDLVILPSRRVVDLAAGEADLAVRMGATGAPPGGRAGAAQGLLTRRLGAAAFAIYGRRGREDGPVIMAPASRTMSKQLAMARRALALNPARGVGPEIDEMHLRAEAIRAGVGIGGLPRWLGDSDPAFVRIEGDGLVFSEEVFLVRHERSKGDPATERLARALARLFRSERRALQGEAATDAGLL